MGRGQERVYDLLEPGNKFVMDIGIWMLYEAHCLRASPVVQMVKNLPAMQETQVQFLGQNMGSQRVEHDYVITCGGWFSRSVMPNSWNSTDCSPLSSSIHRIFQARILDWVAISFSRGSSQCRNQTQVSCTAGRFFTNWATREAQVTTYYFSFLLDLVVLW